MKDKEIEELIDDMIDLAEEGILYTPDYFKTKYKMDEQLSKIKDNKTALLSKFRELEDYKAAFIVLWDFCKEQTHKQIELVKRAEQAEQQVERLKCCGNCYNFYQGIKCPHNYQAINNICNYYDCDNLTRKERET